MANLANPLPGSLLELCPLVLWHFPQTYHCWWISFFPMCTPSFSPIFLGAVIVPSMTPVSLHTWSCAANSGCCFLLPWNPEFYAENSDWGQMRRLQENVHFFLMFVLLIILLNGE